MLTTQPDYKQNAECHTSDGSPKPSHASLMPLATLNLAILGHQILYTHQPTKKHFKPSLNLSPSTSQTPEGTYNSILTETIQLHHYSLTQLNSTYPVTLHKTAQAWMVFKEGPSPDFCRQQRLDLGS